jgi:hypothetical protein
MPHNIKPANQPFPILRVGPFMSSSKQVTIALLYSGRRDAAGLLSECEA